MTEKESFFDKLDDLLEREKMVLIAGALSALPDILSEKEVMLEKFLSDDPPPRDLLEGLNTKLERNQRLLSGTCDGIRKVADRMGELRRVQSSLEVYDGLGKRRSFETTPDTSVEKLA